MDLVHAGGQCPVDPAGVHTGLVRATIVAFRPRAVQQRLMITVEQPIEFPGDGEFEPTQVRPLSQGPLMLAHDYRTGGC